MPVLFWLYSHSTTLNSQQALYLAIHTSLFIILIGSILNVCLQYKHRGLHWDIIKILLPGLLLGSLLGLYLSKAIHYQYLAIIAGTMLILIAISMMKQKLLPSNEIKTSKLKLILTGVFVGAPSAFMGIGGGSLMVPALNRQGLPLSKTAAIASASTFIISFVAVCSLSLATFLSEHHLRAVLGLFDWKTIAVTAPGILIGTHLGAKHIEQIPVIILRSLFITILLISAIHLFRFF